MISPDIQSSYRSSFFDQVPKDYPDMARHEFYPCGGNAVDPTSGLGKNNASRSVAACIGTGSFAGSGGIRSQYGSSFGATKHGDKMNRAFQYAHHKHSVIVAEKMERSQSLSNLATLGGSSIRAKQPLDGRANQSLLEKR